MDEQKEEPQVEETHAESGWRAVLTPKKPEEQAESINFNQIGQTLELNEQNPPRPETIIAPLVSNMFDEEDKPTLAGKVIARVYRQLISRPDYTSPYQAQEVIELGKKSRQAYTDCVKKALTERWSRGDKRITFGIDRKPRTDAFHFDGDTTPSKDHLFYFNKSTSHWKNPLHIIDRAYITLSPQDIESIHQHFVDLCLQMYDAGIDFAAKCVSPNGLIKRLDNMVFYISAGDQPKASELIKIFLQERKLGEGHIDAATPSPQDGLSWAYEPNDKQRKIWREVSGSSRKASFNSLVATMAMPTYLERLAQAHERKGNREATETYRDEANRVKTIIEQLNE